MFEYLQGAVLVMVALPGLAVQRRALGFKRKPDGYSDGTEFLCLSRQEMELWGDYSQQSELQISAYTSLISLFRLA